MVSDIRGPLNGFVVLGWEPADANGKRKTRLRADASVTGGSVTLSEGAGSIQCAELRALGGGDDAILHLKFTGCARAHRPNIWAKADVLWNGPLPERVDAELRFAEAPVSYQGVVLGTATVNAKARPIQLALKLAGPERAVLVSIPALDFELPTKDDTRLVDLDEDPAIHVTELRTPPQRGYGSRREQRVVGVASAGTGGQYQTTGHASSGHGQPVHGAPMVYSTAASSSAKAGSCRSSDSCSGLSVAAFASSTRP